MCFVWFNTWQAWLGGSLAVATGFVLGRLRVFG